VVAKEYEEVLLEAWEQEEQVLIEKEMKVRKCTQPTYGGTEYTDSVSIY